MVDARPPWVPSVLPPEDAVRSFELVSQNVAWNRARNLSELGHRRRRADVAFAAGLSPENQGALPCLCAQLEKCDIAGLDHAGDLVKMFLSPEVCRLRTEALPYR